MTGRPATRASAARTGGRAAARIPAPAAGSPGHRRHASRQRESGPRRGFARLRFPAGWPLLVVLAVQAALSLRLVRADTAVRPADRAEGTGWMAGAGAALAAANAAAYSSPCSTRSCWCSR